MKAARLAAVDIGTNTVRLLVAEVSGPPHARQLAEVRRTSTIVRLGQGVDTARRLAEPAMARALASLAAYREAIAAAGCEAVRAVATSAVRDAANRDDFLDRAAAALGARPETISGGEEAALGFAGATLLARGLPPYLVIDPGGGSTEFVMGEGSPSYAESVDIGSVRLTERLVPRHPAAEGDLAAARRHVDELLAAQVALPSRPGSVLGVGGTFTTLGAIHLGLDAHGAVDGTSIRVEALREITERLARLTVDGIAAIPAVEALRAPVMLGGAVVAERAVVHSGVASVTISQHDILDGVVLAMADASITS